MVQFSNNVKSHEKSTTQINIMLEISRHIEIDKHENDCEKDHYLKPSCGYFGMSCIH